MQWIRSWGAAALAGALAACGGGDSPAPERPMTAASKAVENRVPVVDSLRFAPEEPVPGDQVRAIASVRDLDGDPIDLGFVWEVGGSRARAEGDTLTVPEARKGTPIEVQLIASDGRAESPPQRATTTVGNRSPKIDRVSMDPVPEVGVGERVVAVVDASDPDGDPLETEIVWRVNRQVVQQGGLSYETAGLRRGDVIDARVTVSDGESRAPAVESPVVTVANRPPEVLSQPAGVGPGGVFRYEIEAHDPDGDRNLRFRLRRGPDGMRVDPVLGEVVWRPQAGQTGRHEIEIQVQDGAGASTIHAFDLSVALEETPAPPADLAEN